VNCCYSVLVNCRKNRPLLKESIGRCGDIWQKVHNATNTNQKVKYEADLKEGDQKVAASPRSN
jgi:hypothetical protein